MIKPHPTKPDWFLADRDAVTPVFGVPGIALAREAGLFEIHRSHLPLIETDESLRAMSVGIGPSDWSERDAQTARLGFKLKTTQHQAVDFIRARRGTLLGDEPRVGKTLAAAFSHEPHLGKLVVVAPLMVREVWLSWLRRIWPDTPIGVMKGRSFDADEADKPIVFGHYDILYGWQSGEPIGTLIFDEGHGLANRNSRRSRAAILLASRAKRIVVATGTPIWNLPAGLWNILGLIAPGAFGGHHDFCQRYAAPEPTAYGTVYTGISNGDELSLRLSEVMIRRRWADVQADLPPISRTVEIVDLSLSQRRQLDMAAQNLRTSERTNTAAELARYRDALSIVKLPAIVAKAERYLAAGEPVVLWVWHRNTAEQLMDLLVAGGQEVFAMTGDTPMHRREKILDQWRKMPAAALIVTMSVAQVGIDLSHSHLPIFGEIDYTPAMVAQAEMRTFHPSRAMSVTYVVADHFVDRKIQSALSRKFEASEPVDLHTGDGAITAIDRAFRGEEEAADLDRFMADIFATSPIG